MTFFAGHFWKTNRFTSAYAACFFCEEHIVTSRHHIDSHEENEGFALFWGGPGGFVFFWEWPKCFFGLACDFAAIPKKNAP